MCQSVMPDSTLAPNLKSHLRIFYVLKTGARFTARECRSTPIAEDAVYLGLRALRPPRRIRPESFLPVDNHSWDYMAFCKLLREGSNNYSYLVFINDSNEQHDTKALAPMSWK